MHILNRADEMKWEYAVRQSKSIDDLTNQLPAYGDAGWELINIVNDLGKGMFSAIFKRQKKLPISNQDAINTVALVQYTRRLHSGLV